MPSTFQPKFLRFHETIKLGNTDENATLREKRDAVLKRMRDRGLTFDWFNQGSYAMGIGVVPVQTDYDIDVGVVFTGAARPSDPLALKRAVFDAVNGHTSVPAEWRRHCIRVQYVRSGDGVYHVDLPVYWKDQWNSLSLAVGKQGAGGDQKEWRTVDPKGLVTLITGHLQDEDRWQFRRVIRYLKRWKDYQFPASGNAAPVGIGFAVAALAWFSARKDWGASTSAGYDDLTATLDLVDSIRGRFGYGLRRGEFVTCLKLPLPGQPLSDALEKMTNQQMKEFKERLDKLSSQLADAKRTGRTDELVRAFGADFPA